MKRTVTQQRSGTIRQWVRPRDRTLAVHFTLLFCLGPHTLLGRYARDMTAAESNQLPVAAHGSLERRPVASTSSTAASSGSANEGNGDALAAAHLDTSLPSELVYSLVLNWRGSKQQVAVVESDTVSSFLNSRWGRRSSRALTSQETPLVTGRRLEGSPVQPHERPARASEDCRPHQGQTPWRRASSRQTRTRAGGVEQAQRVHDDVRGSS